MSALGQVTGPSAPGLREFHRRKREVYGLLRGLDRGSREAMRGFDAKGG
jgi:D-ribulokinase